MSSGIQVIQRVEHHGKVLEPVYIELGILDVGVVSFELHVWVELMCRLLSHLSPRCQC